MASRMHRGLLGHHVQFQVTEDHVTSSGPLCKKPNERDQIGRKRARMRRVLA